MFIEKLTLKSFKGFENFTVEFGPGPFTCLVGPNGGGKTTVLQAIRLIYEFVVFSFGNKERPDFSRVYWDADPSSVINRLGAVDPEAIWLRKRTSEPCEIETALSGDVSIHLQICGRSRYTLDIKVRNQSIKKTISELESRRIVEGIFQLKPLFLPPVGTVSGTEQFIPHPDWTARLDRGLETERWREPMFWLWNDGNPEAFNQIIARIKSYFKATDVKPPKLSHDSPPNVVLEFEEEGTIYDIGTSGAGLRSLLNLSSALELSSSRCLLCDEPDAHLHGSLQRAVARMLTDHSNEMRRQIIV